MKRNYQDYINDIKTAIDDIEEFVKNMTWSEFAKDKKTISAVVRSLEIIGEASKKIPAVVRNKYKQIPWKNITGMRDKLIHEYFGVNVKVVWETIKKDIPGIKPVINRMANNT